MNARGNRLQWGLIAVALAVAITPETAMAAPPSRNPNPGVLPVGSRPFGKSFADWSAAWWRWALAIDGDENPIEDPDGGFAGIGQEGKVWFLAGSSSTAEGQLVTRHVTVPVGKAIFFPVLNTVWITAPYLGDPPFSVPGAEEFAREAIAVHPDLDVLSVEVDGEALQDLTSYRVQSTVFTAFLPDYNWFDVWLEYLGIDLDITEGVHFDCVADGYWIMLTPLSKGEHTIHLRGETPDGFVTEVLYHVTVE